MPCQLRHPLLMLLFIVFASCKNNGNEASVIKIVKEWYGKEVVFPSNTVFTIFGQDTVDFSFQKADYKVVIYVDSIGCLSCKLQLDKWKDVIHRIDSVSDVRVPFVFVFSPEKLRDVMYATKSGGFDYPILLDLKGEFNALNHFPDNFNFQTMLLDRDNKVLAIGNPVQNPKILDLYQSVITGQDTESESKASLTMAELDNNVLDFGVLTVGDPQQRIVKLKNTGGKLSIFRLRHIFVRFSNTKACVFVRFSNILTFSTSFSPSFCPHNTSFLPETQVLVYDLK